MRAFSPKWRRSSKAGGADGGRPLSAMPYNQAADLPESVRGHLPAHAQEIYLAAFHNAWRQHASDRDREAIVHRIAWSAVKRSYRKDGDGWVPVGP